MTVTWQSVVTAAAIIAAIVAIIGYLKKVFNWFTKQEEQTRDIDELTDPAKFEELFVPAFTEEMQKAGVAVKAVRIEQYDAEPIM